MRGWSATVSVCLLFCGVAHAADTFPERKVMQFKEYTIEYSAGDEAWAEALSRQLPVDLTTAQPSPATLPITVANLRERRADVLNLVSAQLGLTAPTPGMQQTFDAFVSGYIALQSLKLSDTARHFALWRKAELGARLDAGQEVAGFKRASDGGIEFSIGGSFEFHEGELPEKAMQKMREDWAQLTWPIKIGEKGFKPHAEIQQRLLELRQNAAQMGAFQSEEIQRLGVMTVLHETTEATLVDRYIRSADRRWFCEGVANFVAYRVLEQLAGPAAASRYYDVDAEVAKFAGLKEKVDLEHWPVKEDARSDAVPADVNTASYAFATQRVFEAFGGEKDSLARVLKEVGKTPAEKANIKTIRDAYRSVIAGRKNPTDDCFSLSRRTTKSPHCGDLP